MLIIPKLSTELWADPRPIEYASDLNARGPTQPSRSAIVPTPHPPLRRRLGFDQTARMLAAVIAEAARTPAGRPMRVLEAGVGSGAMLEYLVDLGHDAGIEFYGFDIADTSAAVECLSASRPSEPWDERILSTNSDRWPFDDAFFDVVISNQVLEHVTDMPVFLRECRRVLRDPHLPDPPHGDRITSVRTVRPPVEIGPREIPSTEHALPVRIQEGRPDVSAGRSQRRAVPAFRDSLPCLERNHGDSDCRRVRLRTEKVDGLHHWPRASGRGETSIARPEANNDSRSMLRAGRRTSLLGHPPPLGDSHDRSGGPKRLGSSPWENS